LRQEACKTERHHAVPRHVLAARRRAEVERTEITGAGIQAWLDYEEECFSHGVDPDLSLPELEALVEGSCVVVSWEEHRRVLHAGEWAEWGRIGGRATLARYGRAYFRALALRRHRRISPTELAEARRSPRRVQKEEAA
jgi:hypothetical protein